MSEPEHYKWHPTGIQCRDVVEHFPANLASAIEYIWRCDYKHDDPIEDLEKAIAKIQREIELRRGKNDRTYTAVEIEPFVEIIGRGLPSHYNKHEVATTLLKLALKIADTASNDQGSENGS
ncbi:MAG: hypothetical protein AAF402_17370 [Pseudomonadota bacterium]